MTRDITDVPTCSVEALVVCHTRALGGAGALDTAGAVVERVLLRLAHLALRHRASAEVAGRTVLAGGGARDVVVSSRNACLALV
jgi:hypothetical protein